MYIPNKEADFQKTFTLLSCLSFLWLLSGCKPEPSSEPPLLSIHFEEEFVIGNDPDDPD
jgi:hypothetical protein